jgi:hypothetical protein
VVSCTGITGYRIETGKEDDYVDVLLSGTHTNDRGVILVGAGNDTVWGGNGGEKILGQTETTSSSVGGPAAPDSI